jgi:hypothetical protein
VAPPYKLVQSRHGWMLVNPNDAYLGQAILQYGECCEIEVAFLLQLLAQARAGDGSRHQYRHPHGAGRQGPGTAEPAHARFEPQPVIFQNMCANLALNAIGNVTAWPSACGDRAGTLWFAQPDYSAGGNFGGVSMSTEPLRTASPFPASSSTRSSAPRP